jgi:hypothetical protein
MNDDLISPHHSLVWYYEPKPKIKRIVDNYLVANFQPVVNASQLFPSAMPSKLLAAMRGQPVSDYSVDIGGSQLTDRSNISFTFTETYSKEEKAAWMNLLGVSA